MTTIRAASMSATLLVTVEEAHPARGRDIVVMPRIIVHAPAGPPFAVRLDFPDGSQRDAMAALDVAHIRGPQGAFALVRLIDFRVEDVPSGTRISRMETAEARSTVE